MPAPDGLSVTISWKARGTSAIATAEVSDANGRHICKMTAEVSPEAHADIGKNWKTVTESTLDDAARTMSWAIHKSRR